MRAQTVPAVEATRVGIPTRRIAVDATTSGAQIDPGVVTATRPQLAATVEAMSRPSLRAGSAPRRRSSNAPATQTTPKIAQQKIIAASAMLDTTCRIRRILAPTASAPRDNVGDGDGHSATGVKGL